MRTRPNSPRTGRRRKFRLVKSKRRPRAKRPAQLAATVGRRRVRRSRGR